MGGPKVGRIGTGGAPEADAAQRAAQPVSAVRFSRLVRALGFEGRGLGLKVPGFRSPPRIPGNRTIRRFPDGQAVVAVALKGRTEPEVWADLVEGLLAFNGVNLVDAARLRSHLLPLHSGETERDAA